MTAARSSSTTSFPSPTSVSATPSPTRRPRAPARAAASPTGSSGLPRALCRLRPLRPGDPPGAHAAHRAAGAPDRRSNRPQLPPRRAQGRRGNGGALVRPGNGGALVRLRALASILAVAALVAAGVTFSGAAYTAASANPGNNFSTAAVFPSATLTDPGTPLRGTVTLDATTAGPIVSVTIQRSPAGAGAWTNICTDNSSPYSCSFDTTVPADGLYDLRATADTGSGTVASAVVANRRIDNTAPSVAMTDPGTPLSGTVNVGATATDVGGSGVSSVTIQRSPAGAGTWTDVCTDSSSPYSCSFDTTTVGDALYDFRAVGTDRKSTRLNSSHITISYAVFCL